MKHERSCGAILFRRREDFEFLIIKHKQETGNHWDFPKGHVEEGETGEQTAAREVHEETGLTYRQIPDFKAEVTYQCSPTAMKTVIFFLGEAHDGEVTYIFDELDDHAWLPFDAAMERLTHDNARELLQKANDHLRALRKALNKDPQSQPL